MALEKAILGYTKTQVPSVSDRVYALYAPQGTSKPYLVFTVVSNNFIHSLGEDSGLCETRVQFSVFGDGYAGVKGVVDELKAAYRNYVEGQKTTEMSNEHWVQVTLLNAEVDMYEEDTGLFHTSLDVVFWHME